MNGNDRGIVLCFLVYIALCATIVSIIEMPWLVVPVGSKFTVDISELMQNNATAYVTANVSASSDGNVTWLSTVPGYCGISGYCYPFEDDSVIVSMLSGSWGQRCQQMDPLLPMSQGGHFDVVQHVPLYMTIAGSVFLLFTWIVGICACCNQDCGHCTIYSVIAVMITFSASVFLVGGLMLFVFAHEPSSCIKRLCGDVGDAFEIGHCFPGWSLYVAVAGLLFAYVLAIASCVLASKTPLRSHGKANQIIEVQPASSGVMRRPKTITTRT